ncbi:hypothetical protein JCM10207_001218 [Rhodosporidiobolus poonsookiae]
MLRPTACVLAALLLLAQLASSAPLAPSILTRRQDPTLSFAYDTNPVIYRSSTYYSCSPVSLAVDGAYPPFSIDVVAADDTAKVLKHVAELKEPGTRTWKANVEDGTRVVFRVTDNTGASLLSEEREVTEGSWSCQSREPSFYEILGAPIAVWLTITFVLCGGLLLLPLEMIVWSLIKERRARRAAKKRRQAARARAQAAPPPVVVQRERPAPVVHIPQPPPVQLPAPPPPVARVDIVVPPPAWVEVEEHELVAAAPPPLYEEIIRKGLAQG